MLPVATKGVDDLGGAWITGIHAMDAEISPYWRQAAKGVSIGETVDADDALGFCCGI
jgi:hypothetical protein